MSIGVAPHRLRDPYDFHKDEVAEPPRTFLAILRRIGPGMILAASIVGSGELIATTTLGAEVGYVALWVIILSCVIKPAIQSELGRYVIATGQTGLEAFDLVPGPRAGVNWVVWAWAVMVTMTMFQIGAMFGGVAQVLTQVMPGVHLNVWIALLVALSLFLLLGGGYERVERLATIKVGLFTMLTFLCAIVLMRQPQYFSWVQIRQGLTFELPGQGLATAIAVFGITGVGAAELLMYPYWCVEKGYARFTGPRDNSAEWKRRALGWIRVMNVDIIASMIVYCVATLAFYLLGAGILHGRGLMPAAQDMIPVLSTMYTGTLGEWSLYLFYAGAIATLYGTIFAATAANSRAFADLCRLLGKFGRNDYEKRLKFRNAFVWFLILVPACLIYLFQSPVLMVKAGGVAQALMLPVIAVTVLFLRHRRTPVEIRPSVWLTINVWIASVVIIVLMAYYAVLSLR